jgi:hypothetical protein
MSEQKTFTSWRDLRARILDDLADPAYRKMGQYSITAGGTAGSRTVSYRSLTELKAMLDWVELQIQKEEGSDYEARTYAKNGGRG